MNNETIVHPFCFNRPWMSGDNFEEFAEVFKIKKLGQFFEKLYCLWAVQFPILVLIRPSWCSSDGECEKISLAAQLEQCSPANLTLKIEMEQSD